MVTTNSRFTRRSFCLCCVGGAAVAAAGGWLSPRAAYAEARGLVTLIKDSAATTPITTHKLSEGVSVLEGSGGNVAVLTGPDGKFLVDAGISVSRTQMTKALTALGHEPITHLINTHWHFDHTDGNAWLNESGAKIIAHANTRKHISEIQRVEDWDYNFLPMVPGAIPTEVFSSERQMTLNGETIEMRYYGTAHTDSDISVMFRNANILHTGDTFWNGIYPFIDHSTGGSIDGMIAAANANLALALPSTKIIPGHGFPISNRAELQAWRDMLVTIRDNVGSLKMKGMEREEAVKAQPTKPFDAKYGQFLIDPGFFTRLVYQGV